MIFIILFFIAVLGIIILHYKTRKNTDEKLLHRLKKSCSINSVQFEKEFISFIFFIKKQRYRIFYKMKGIFYRLIGYKENVINKTKKNIRKKLFVETQKEKVSEFISEMKK